MAAPLKQPKKNGPTHHADDDDSNTTYIRLLETEDLMLMSGSRLVSTLTWFKVDNDDSTDNVQAAATCLKERLVKLLSAAPWLTGRIVRRKNINYLAHPKHVDALKAVDEIFQLIPAQESPLERTTPIIEASALARHSGWTVKPKWNNPVYAVTVVPCRRNPTMHFCIVVSMSHIIGDGHTFYTLYNYLIGAETRDDVDDNIVNGTNGSVEGDGNKAAVEAAVTKSDKINSATTPLPQLEVTRIATSLQQTQQAIKGNRAAHREPLLAQSLSFLVPSAIGLIAGKLRAVCCKSHQTQQHYMFLDSNVMGRLKEQAMSQDKDVSFCSTNDVITSWFLTNSQCRHGFMAVNVRGRLDGHTERHAGNYFTLVYYRIPNDCNTPALIRQSIVPLQRHVTKDQPPARLLLGGGCILTSWATFATDKVTLLPGNDKCREELHCPLFTHQLDAHPANVVIGIVFRARHKQLGLFVCGTPSKIDKLVKDCPFQVQGDFV